MKPGGCSLGVDFRYCTRFVVLERGEGMYTLEIQYATTNIFHISQHGIELKCEIVCY